MTTEREALEQIRALWCPLCGTSPTGSEPECSWCVRLADILASVDAPAPCPICQGPSRETVGLVCQTCGRDYGRTGEQ